MHAKVRQVAFLSLAAFCICCTAGCYQKGVQGDTSVYAFAWWLGVLVIVGGLVFVPVGWFLRYWSSKLGWWLIILGPLLLVIIAPAMYSDKVVIDNDHFEARYGLWFAPKQHDIRFDDLQEIRHVGVRDSRNRVSYQLQCVRKVGEVEVVSSGDLVRNAVPEILSRAQAKNVRVVQQEAP